MKIIGIEHIGIATNNLSKAKKFWSLVLGIENTCTEDIENQGVITDIYDTGVGKIELILPKYPKSAIAKFINKRGTGIHHICLRVENIDEAMKELKEKTLRPSEIIIHMALKAIKLFLFIPDQPEEFY